MTSTSTRATRPGGDVLDGLAEARALAQAAGRGDLAGRLDAAARRLRSEEATVAVVGEFKQGKSTLVNALLRTDICPVDADIVTAVPTILRFGRPPAAFLRLDGVEEPLPIAFDDLRRYITEGSGARPPRETEPAAPGQRGSQAAAPGQRGSQQLAPGQRGSQQATPGGEGEARPATRGVEVRLDRRLLGAGLSIIDTPGVGGLDSAQGNLTLAALSLAGAALFVTDAAQELTAPEVDFLRRALERCPRAFCVLTKTDLYGEWRRIAEINEGHLRRAGLDVPIVAVSSFLRMRAQARDSTQLNEESGFPRLVDVLRRDVLGAAAANKEAAARAELTFVVGQLRERVDAERAVAATPAKTPEVVRRYAEKTRRGAWLAGGSWQTVLGDGVQDLSSDVEHDLRERLRLMVRRGEDLIDESDPKETWRDFQAWAQREAASAAVDNLMLLVTRTEQLAHDVAERFGLEYDSLDVDLPAPELALEKVDELDVSFQKSGVQQFLGAFTAARVTYGGIYMIGAVGAFFSLALAPIGLLAGMTLGRRMIKSERERQVLQRRLQAKGELRRYVDDVGFHVGRDCREAIRRTQRFLRDEFATRAQAVERSAAATEAAVREVAELPPDQRQAKVAQLAEARRRLDRLAA